jgi:hypothetical protein
MKINEMKRVLVLNADNSPINVLPFQKAFKLAFRGKASVVSHIMDNPIKCVVSDENYLNLIDECPTLLTDDGKGFKRPTILRLNKYKYIPFKKVTLSRNNIYRRDDYTCVYCGTENDLTIDHVIPRSKGGKNTWENLVTCCGTCNVTKCNKDLDVFLEEQGYDMISKPYKPTYLEFISNNRDIHEHWKEFI